MNMTLKLDNSLTYVQVNEILAESLRIISEIEGVTIAEMKSRSRYRPIAEARQIHCYIMKEAFNKRKMSLAVIGNSVNRDHATVLHSVTLIRDLMHTQTGYRQKIDYITDKVLSAVEPTLEPDSQGYITKKIELLKKTITEHEAEIARLSLLLD